jgi:hypothetical protein
MEANFFRRLAAELGDTLPGKRIDTVFGPGRNAWTIELSGPRPAPHLIFRPAKSAGLLFLCARKPQNPKTPSARVMWLRKRLSGRRLFAAHADWPGLKLAFALSPAAEPDAGRFLVLDLRQGLFLAQDLDAAFDREASWPELAAALADPEVWRGHPQFSPALRRRLAGLDPARAAALYAELIAGQAKRFFARIEADPPGPPLVFDAYGASGRSFASALEAATAFGERVLFPELARERDRAEVSAATARRRRLSRTLATLDAEKARLGDMLAAKPQALALQIALSSLEGRPLPLSGSIELPGPDGTPILVVLDPAKSPCANMAALFARAAKGERGLAHLARRRRELAAELSGLPGPARRTDGAAATPEAAGPAPLPRRLAGVAAAVFRSSDGFLILRGKNDAANHALIRRAAPDDLWLHVADGPGSHVVVRREFAGQEVPRRTIEEAAVLAGLKSFCQASGAAEVHLALIRHVRIPKGAKPGQVAVEKTVETLRVRLDPGIEARLG